MPDPLDRAPARLVGLLVAAVAGVTAIGFMTGISGEEYEAVRPPARERPIPADVPPARTHAQLERHPWPIDSGWEAGVELVGTQSADPGGIERDRASIEDALHARSALRAYDGAPPVIPHPVRSGGAAECLACHDAGFSLGGRSAGRLPHADYASCTQCHVSSSSPFEASESNAAAMVASSWSGLDATSRGTVAYSGAPPAVPHPTRMRDQCESCHGEGGRLALRTPHTERQSCLQCLPATGNRVARASR